MKIRKKDFGVKKLSALIAPLVLAVVLVGCDSPTTTPIYHSVTFNANRLPTEGGAQYLIVQVRHGEDVILPTNPTRSGYTFSGWYTAPTGGTRAVLTAITDSLTVWASWNPVIYHDIIFNANRLPTEGGAQYLIVQVRHGEDVILPTNPTRSGYTFSGWYTAPTGGTRAVLTAITGSLTVWARWNPVNLSLENIE